MQDAKKAVIQGVSCGCHPGNGQFALSLGAEAPLAFLEETQQAFLRNLAARNGGDDLHVFRSQVPGLERSHPLSNPRRDMLGQALLHQIVRLNQDPHPRQDVENQPQRIAVP